MSVLAIPIPTLSGFKKGIIQLLNEKGNSSNQSIIMLYLIAGFEAGPAFG